MSDTINDMELVKADSLSVDALQIGDLISYNDEIFHHEKECFVCLELKLYTDNSRTIKLNKMEQNNCLKYFKDFLLFTVNTY